MTHATLAALIAGSLVMLPACSSSMRHPAPTTRLSAADFAGATVAPAAPRQATPPAADHAAPAGPTSGVLDLNQPGNRNVTITTPAGASQGIENVAAAPGTPTVEGPRPARVGEAVLVDAKVGEVNGKPVYTSTFFDVGSPTIEALGPRLANAARTMTRPQWTTFARQEIDQRLGLIVQDELFRAEALSALTPEQKQGLFAFVQGLQDDLRRQGGGSREALKRQIEETGLTADQWSRKREQEVLIEYQLQQKVLRRINVSWRDISLAYNGRLYEQYHHAPRYRFWLVTIPKDATEDRANFEAALASGASFPDLAGGKLNRFKNDRGGLEVRELKGELADAQFFPSAELNTAAKGLQSGKWSDPVDLGASNAWVFLERIDTPPDLYDAQLEIERTLRELQVLELKRRYFERLFGRASVTSIPEMRARLLQIAVERYAPAENR